MAIHFEGIPAEILKGHQMAAAVEKAAEEIADKIKGQGIMVEGEPGNIDLPVKVVVYGDSDRSRASVFLAHPSGLAVQAKHGALSKAASEAGFEVKGK